MGYLDDIDASYAEHERMANFYQGVDANQQHAAHLVMQQLVADRNAYLRRVQSAAPAEQGGDGGGGPAPAPPPPPASPPPPTTFSVKQPEVSLVQYDAQVLPQELIEDLLYEQVGGQELINIARHDTINGQVVSYSLVRNLSLFNQQFNPNNVLAGQVAYTLQLGQHAIDIAMNVSSKQFASLDENGNLVIELDYVGADELIEAEISTDGTIYRLGAA